ncbi:phosphatidylinositol-3-phosphatase SAC1-like isoform X2 [Tachypleus tridentatus]|uniref:phosphatidylinositol-3-phosphatase SAC1-like isoform X2 n=1 Tax=Tachypleus tridentatus TaxID=6853 RepID=UPI003FD56C2A
MSNFGVASAFGNFYVYEDLLLHVTAENFFLEPQISHNEVLVIDRISREISLKAQQDQVPPHASGRLICGIVGIITLLSGPYLVIITKKSKVGEINGQNIWRVEETEILSYSRTLLHLTEEQIQYNKVYLSMVRSVLHTPHFYFSTSYDLTHTLQRLHNTSPDFLQMSLFERADQRFVWNNFLMRDLIAQPELHRYCLPVLHGFITIKTSVINRKTFTWCLISRRSWLHAGTRYFMRGVDSEGHVANFIETEQIVERDGCMTSFVQTRGSIPLFWSQMPNLKRKPSPRVINNENHIDSFSKHFNNQIFNYGRQVLINLVDQKGAEGHLEKCFSEMVQASKSPNIRYEAFDFHHECRKMRWDRLSILINKLAPVQDDLGYFLMLKDGTAVLVQDGVFRTNCIDCLDRTNVVQNMVGRRSLQQQLQKLGILNKDQKVEDHVNFEVVYRNVWADNADVCSIQYAGTSALKTDFTRTGKRSIAGLLSDGWNTLVRYYKNNFADGFRQDAIDLFLGNYNVEENEGVTKLCPLMKKKDMKLLALPIVLLIALAMSFYCLLTPPVHTTETIMYVIFWAVITTVTLTVILYFGAEFVDCPKLQEFRPKLKVK